MHNALGEPLILGKPLFSEDFTQSNKDIAIQENALVQLWKESDTFSHSSKKLRITPTLTGLILSTLASGLERPKKQKNFKQRN